LRYACSKYPHIQIKEDWNNEQIMEAIGNAQINVLPTFQGTGIKLKLLNSLYAGRHCVVNPMMVDHTGLENACHIAKTSQDMVAKIKSLLTLSFTETDIKARKKILNNSCYNNEANTEHLVQLLFP
jgi:hypothetical protein